MNEQQKLEYAIKKIDGEKDHIINRVNELTDRMIDLDEQQKKLRKRLTALL